jgi:hypothetical protein
MKRSLYLHAGLLAALSAFALTAAAAPTTNVFPGAPNVSPNWDNLAAAVVDTDAGGTVLVQPGLYEITASINLDKPISIIGPLDGVNTDSVSGPRSGILLGGYNRNTLAQGEASFASNVGDALSTTVISIGASDITIAGLDFETSSIAHGILRSPVGLGLNNITIRDNVFRKELLSSANTNSQHAVRIENATNVTISGNSTRNLRGGQGGSPDHGVIWILNSSNVNISHNEIRNTGDVDRVGAIQVTGTTASNNIVITRNRIWGNSALSEAIGKYAISFGPTGTTNDAEVSYNDILDFSQAGISLERSNVRIFGNRISSIAPSSFDHQAGIYVRNAAITSITATNNIIGSNPFQRTTPVAAGINLLAYATTLRSNGSLFNNNIYFNNRQVNGTLGPDRVSFGVQPTTSWGTNCATALDITNSWWGSASGPVSARRTGAAGYGGASGSALMTDPCTLQVLPESTNSASGSGDSIGNKGRNSTQPLRFFPWALFRGDYAFAGPGTGSLTIPGEDTPPLGNDRYWLHNLSVSGLSAEGRIQIWPSASRQGVDNSADFSVTGASFTTASITVHYQPGAESIIDESTVRLVKWNAATSKWALVPGATLDTTSNTVTGVVTQLGQYAARENGGAPTPDLSGPAVVGLNTSGGFVQNQGPLLLTNAAGAFFEASSANLTSATAVINVTPDGANEVLTADTTGTGITALYDAPSRTLTLSGTDTVANYNTVLRTIRYNNSAGSPTSGARIVSISGSNVYGTGDAASATITSVILPVSLSGMSVE